MQSFDSPMAQLRNTRPVGRPVIDVEAAVVAPGHPESDIGLRRGDTLTIQPITRYVIGEVRNQTAHIWKRGLKRDDHLSLSDGAPRSAASMSSGLVAASLRQSLRAGSPRAIRLKHQGDTVMVPLHTKKTPSLVNWQGVRYNIAIPTVAVHAL